MDVSALPGAGAGRDHGKQVDGPGNGGERCADASAEYAKESGGPEQVVIGVYCDQIEDQARDPQSNREGHQDRVEGVSLDAGLRTHGTPRGAGWAEPGAPQRDGFLRTP